MALNNPQKINKTLAFPLVNGEQYFGVSGADLTSLTNKIHTAHNATLFVETNGSDNDAVADGSILRPYATLAKALTEASAGTDIILGNGTHTVTNLEISTNGITITTNGLGDSTVISGNVAIAESTNKIRISGVKISGNFTDNGTGQNVLENVTVTGSFTRADAGGFLNFLNGELNTVAITGATATGSTFVSGTKITGAISVDSTNHTAHFFGCPQLGTVTHGGGRLLLESIRVITKTTGNSINSTATASDNASLKLIAVNLKQPTDGTYGLINKTGNCAYEISADTNRDEVNDVLTGTRAQVSFAKDVAANFTPTAYTPVDVSVKGHLQGIETALGNISSALAGDNILVLVGGHNASTGAYPTTGRQGGAIQAGDLWKITTAGTIGTNVLQIGDSIVALVDSPTSDTDWMVIQANVDYATESTMGLVTLAGTADVATAAAAAANNTDVMTPARTAAYLDNVIFNVPNGFRQQYTLTAGAETVVNYGLNTEDIIVMLVNPADGAVVTAFYDIDIKVGDGNTIGITSQTADTIEVRVLSFRA